MIRLIPILFVLLQAAPSGNAARQQPQPAVRSVRIAAASDLRFVLDDIISRLGRRDPALGIEVVYGSSGNFHAQLSQRAPFDLYLSADMSYPRDLVARGIGSEQDLFVYAVGRLVVWIPNGSALPLERERLAALREAHRVAIANPRHAPYGRAAEAALRNAGLWEQLQPRLVIGETVAQTAQFVQSGAADAGLIARSLVAAPAMANAGRYWEIPSGEHPSLVQGGLVLPWASSREGALTVRDYLIGEAGRRVFASYGFDPPPKPRRGSSEP